MKPSDILAALMAFYRFRCEDEGIEYVESLQQMASESGVSDAVLVTGRIQQV